MLNFTKQQHLIIILFACALIIGSVIQLFLYLDNKSTAQVIIPKEIKTQTIGLKDESSTIDKENKPQNDIYIHIVGAVKIAGMYKMIEGSRVNDAVKAAGGATSNADLDQINLAEKLRDEEKIYVPKKGELERLKSENRNQSSNQNGNNKNAVTISYHKENKIPEVQSGKINLNTASKAQLESLPGIGPAIAKRIIEYRTQQGRFTSIEELDNVDGIGESKLSKIMPLVEVR